MMQRVLRLSVKNPCDQSGWTAQLRGEGLVERDNPAPSLAPQRPVSPFALLLSSPLALSFPGPALPIVPSHHSHFSLLVHVFGAFSHLFVAAPSSLSADRLLHQTFESNQGPRMPMSFPIAPTTL